MNFRESIHDSLYGFCRETSWNRLVLGVRLVYALSLYQAHTAAETGKVAPMLLNNSPKKPDSLEYSPQ